MEQNNNTGRMGLREGDVASGGRSWENKPQKGAEEVEVD